MNRDQTITLVLLALALIFSGAHLGASTQMTMETPEVLFGSVRKTFAVILRNFLLIAVVGVSIALAFALGYKVGASSADIPVTHTYNAVPSIQVATSLKLPVPKQCVLELPFGRTPIQVENTRLPKDDTPDQAGSMEELENLDEPIASCGDPVEVVQYEELEGVDYWKAYISDICAETYTNVDPYVVYAVIERESNWDPNVTNPSSGCAGLMQLALQYYGDSMKRLGITDPYDPISNITLGVDLISQLTDKYGDIRLVLMLYSSRHDTAMSQYKAGNISSYAKTVLARAEELRRES